MSRHSFYLHYNREPCSGDFGKQPEYLPWRNSCHNGDRRYHLRMVNICSHLFHQCEPGCHHQLHRNRYHSRLYRHRRINSHCRCYNGGISEFTNDLFRSVGNTDSRWRHKLHMVDISNYKSYYSKSDHNNQLHRNRHYRKLFWHRHRHCYGRSITNCECYREYYRM